VSRERAVPQEFEGEQLEHVFVGRRDGQARPTVMLIPTIMGVSALEIGFARQLVELGYNGLVADLYGKEFRGAPRETVRVQMDRLRADRGALRRRLLVVLEHMRSLAEVAGERVAVAGYCFGGMCALDVARSGVDIAAAVAFHGLFDPPGLPPEPIRAKVVAFHGWDDPYAKPEMVLKLADELTAAGADWQIHAYGKVEHGFTNTGADGSVEGVKYNALAAERSWTSFINLLEEVFGGH
jgi:dienelactone hydrolase